MTNDGSGVGVGGGHGGSGIGDDNVGNENGGCCGLVEGGGGGCCVNRLNYLKCLISHNLIRPYPSSIY